ncbi:MAG TPA: hypothetical protein VKS19_00075 [Verrucomicrobiae bacterium]|nr:hypothetical protein [Verrucomicrobiae bacterium]
MEKVARKFRSFAEADKADRESYPSFTPEQRLEMLFDLIAWANPRGTEQRIERVGRIIRLQED